MFSWLFGSGGGAAPAGPPPPPASSDEELQARLSSGAGPAAEGGPLDPAKMGSFDPTVLERIAAAARELQGSENATAVVELVREQERTWQQKFAAARQDAEAKAKQLELEGVSRAQEEQRRTMEYQTQQEQQREQLKDRVARQRYDDQLRQQQQLGQQQLAAQEESTRRQEAERRKSIEYEAELRRQTEMVKARAEAEARAIQERENRDIRDAQLIMQAEEHRKTVLEGIKLAGTTVGDGLSAYLSDGEKIAATVGVVTALALGVYSTRAGAKVGGELLANRLRKPPLVRDTSRTNPLLHPLRTLRSLTTRATPETALGGMVLQPETTARLQAITLATSRTRQHGANFRHVMLYGPPGTGKTMFARRLAHQSGLEYAMLAGGDVGVLGNDASDEIHKVFDWAQTSRKGVLLFVDEADAFLRKRGEKGDGHMSEATRNALSTFLYRTGDPTDKFMLVMSTNEPEVSRWAHVLRAEREGQERAKAGRRGFVFGELQSVCGGCCGGAGE